MRTNPNIKAASFRVINRNHRSRRLSTAFMSNAFKGLCTMLLIAIDIPLTEQKDSWKILIKCMCKILNAKLMD